MRIKKGIAASFLLSLVFILSIVAAPYASAQDSVTGLIPCTKSAGPSKEASGLNCDTWEDFIGVIQFLINYSFVIATILATVSIAYAGWLYLTSNGNPGQVSKAHAIFFKVIQGFLVLAAAYLLVKFILNTISYSDYNKLE